jgi:hypothetical protein
MKPTELAAWVGATSGLGSLMWNIYTKLTSGPQLAVTAFANMIMIPSPPNNPRLLRIIIQNRGTAPTTITGVDFYTYESRWYRLLSRAKLKKRAAKTRLLLAHYEGPRFPHKLEIGEEWRAVMQQDERFEEWLQTDKLCCAVWHSFSRQPTSSRVVRGPI